ncbi:hypothetical protein FIBSPDRAFT_903082 [Athelia psychrophila]|uniref:Uncharacterized protein n=1 Tax=Athelia psychrophila TaxID=1759441 RepID=A0A167WEV5_9AGAM|nr:hypothetical protein FIBSPDRAFT_903082 [Fibularhizoctonia sp. CBS 109695]
MVRQEHQSAFPGQMVGQAPGDVLFVRSVERVKHKSSCCSTRFDDRSLEKVAKPKEASILVHMVSTALSYANYIGNELVKRDSVTLKGRVKKLNMINADLRQGALQAKGRHSWQTAGRRESIGHRPKFGHCRTRMDRT